MPGWIMMGRTVDRRIIGDLSYIREVKARMGGGGDEGLSLDVVSLVGWGRRRGGRGEVVAVSFRYELRWSTACTAKDPDKMHCRSDDV